LFVTELLLKFVYLLAHYI